MRSSEPIRPALDTTAILAFWVGLFAGMALLALAIVSTGQ